MRLQKTLWLLGVLAAVQGCGATRSYVIERDRGTLDKEANTTSTSEPRWKIERTPAAAAAAVPVRAADHTAAQQ